MNNQITPRSFIKGMLRQIFLKSRERATASKRDDYSCQKCGIKASKTKDKVVKVQVHHVKGINVWDSIIDSIYDDVLCTDHLEDLQTLCVDCHKSVTNPKEIKSKHIVNGFPRTMLKNFGDSKAS